MGNQYAAFPASGGLQRSASQEHGERDVLTTKKRMKRGLLYLMVLKVSTVFNNLESTGAPDEDNFCEVLGPEAAVQ